MDMGGKGGFLLMVLFGSSAVYTIKAFVGDSSRCTFTFFHFAAVFIGRVEVELWNNFLLPKKLFKQTRGLFYEDFCDEKTPL